MRRIVIRLLGASLVLAALAYFVVHAARTLSDVDLGSFARPDVLLGLLSLTVLYTCCVIPNAFGWHRIVVALGSRIRYRRSLAILAFTQIGKYLPGNVGHHIGRVGLARAEGVTVATGLYSVGYEAILAALASIHIGAIVFLWRPPQMVADHPVFAFRLELMILLSLGGLLTIRMAPLAMRVISRMRGDLTPSRNLELGWAPALTSYLCSSSGLALVGVGLWLMASSLGTAASANVLFFIGAFAASWIIGFLTPGAPAGLGVREAVLSLWLGTVIPPAETVVLIIALRLATTVGDLVNFLLGAWATASVRRTAAVMPK